jgi:hypothetical protein
MERKQLFLGNWIGKYQAEKNNGNRLPAAASAVVIFNYLYIL